MVFIESHRTFPPEYVGWEEEECGSCGRIFQPESVPLLAVYKSPIEIGSYCQECGTYLGEGNPDRSVLSTGEEHRFALEMGQDRPFEALAEAS